MAPPHPTMSTLPPLERIRALRLTRSRSSTLRANASDAWAVVSYSIRHTVFLRQATRQTKSCGVASRQHQHPTVSGSGYHQWRHAQMPPPADVRRVALVPVTPGMSCLEVFHPMQHTRVVGALPGPSTTSKASTTPPAGTPPSDTTHPPTTKGASNYTADPLTENCPQKRGYSREDGDYGKIK